LKLKNLLKDIWYGSDRDADKLTMGGNHPDNKPSKAFKIKKYTVSSMDTSGESSGSGPSRASGTIPPLIPGEKLDAWSEFNFNTINC
jgi:hypothetical protein